MPPKAKITVEMIIDAGVELVKAEGAESINARTVAKKLGCSTQPVMYHFNTIDSLRMAIYKRLDDIHTQYIMNISPHPKDISLGIGLNYVRFAAEEPNCFRFLFQSGLINEHSIIEMIDSDDIMPVIAALQEETQLNIEQTKIVFHTICMFVHGYASLIANNSLEFDEKLTAVQINRTFRGAILALNEETKQLMN